MSDRLTAWLRWREMVSYVNHASATGYEFLLNARPAYPRRTARLEWEQATRVEWSDGVTEDILDIDRKGGEGNG